MSRSRRSSDWWDIALYLGILILFVVFVFQLLKLWAAAAGSFANFLQMISQAASNTLGAVETGFQNLLTAPATFSSNFFGNISSFIDGLLAFIPALFAGFLGFVTGGAFAGLSLGSLFSPTTPISSSNGSSYPPNQVDSYDPTDPTNQNSSGSGSTFSAPASMSSGT